MLRVKDAIVQRPKHAIERNSRSLFDLDTAHFKTFLDNHVATANYLISPHDFTANVPNLAADRIFHSNNSIWESVNYERVRSEKHVILESFFLFDWFPRAPGLFYTRRGREARREAKRNFQMAENGILISHAQGKTSLIDGGIGNVRLQPIQIEESTYILMSASSSGICHEGFPVAVPTSIYERYQDEIAERGFAHCTLVGKLKFVPERLVSLYPGDQEVPQLYLIVEDIRLAANAKSWTIETPYVSVAISVLCEAEGKSTLYASCINFAPGTLGAFDEKLDWMRQTITGGRYQGRVLTDFDERQTQFSDAIFGLKQVMDLALDTPETTATMERLHIDGAARMLKGFNTMRMLSLSVEDFIATKFEAQLHGLGSTVHHGGLPASHVTP